MIFLLWGFVALGLLFWGRGVYCGWLCPFGALQELTNELAQRLKIPQIAVPFGLHERLWVIKYTLFLGLLALSFLVDGPGAGGGRGRTLQDRDLDAVPARLAVRRLRAGAAGRGPVHRAGSIAAISARWGQGWRIPAKLKLFDWLRRRPQCGRECRLCEQKCTVGAIDPIGRINPNECVLCLRCQTIFHDPTTCTVLKRRQPRQVPAEMTGLLRAVLGRGFRAFFLGAGVFGVVAMGVWAAWLALGFAGREAFALPEWLARARNDLRLCRCGPSAGSS